MRGFTVLTLKILNIVEWVSMNFCPEFKQEGGQALIIAVRICAQSVRSLCACAPTSVEVLGFFLFAHSNAHRLLCSPLRTDVGAHAHRLRTDCAQMRTAAVRILTDVCAHLHRSDVQFRTDHSSPLLTDVGAHAHRLRTDCAQTAHRCAQTSVRILTARYTIPHRRSPQTSFIATTTNFYSFLRK